MFLPQVYKEDTKFTVEYYSFLKRKEIFPYETTGTQKGKYGMIPLISGIYHRLRLRVGWWFPGVRGEGSGELSSVDIKLSFARWSSSSDPLNNIAPMVLIISHKFFFRQ